MPPLLARFKTWSRRRRAMVVVGALLLAVAVMRFAWFVYLSKPSRQITIGRETTFVDGPLGDDGCIDYIAASEELASAGVTPENNAVVLMWEAFGAKETTVENWRDQFRRLGAPVPPNAVVETIPLDLLVEASRRPRCYAPSISSPAEGYPRHLGNVVLPLAQSQRNGIGRLVGRAGQRLGEGDVEAAWSDALAAHRLARLVAQDRFLINLLVGLATERTALDFDEALLVSEHLTANQARACLHDLSSLPPPRTVADTIDQFERLIMLDMALVVARGERVDLGQDKRLDLALSGAIDWNVVLRHINEYCDRYVAALREPAKLVRESQLAELAHERAALPETRIAFALEAYLGRREQASREIAAVICGLPGEHVLTAHETEARTMARFRAIQIGFALAAWQREHGEYPESLAVLVPDLLPEIPVDPTNGETLLYRRTEKGYLISRKAVPPDDVILRIGDEEE
jgi:hypothetical protein